MPVFRPDDAVSSARTQDDPSGKASAEKEKTDERPQEDAAELAACISALQNAGATFEKAEAVGDGSACGIDAPLRLTGLPGGVALRPEAVTRCQTALQLSRWMEESVRPSLARAMPGETIESVSQASAYVCRKRNNAKEGRISEHAFGNAIDIAGFTLKSGKVITIRPTERDSTLEGAFLRAITAAACLYFTTVLDPSSDAAHETHLHLDVKARGGGYRYCW